MPAAYVKGDTLRAMREKLGSQGAVAKALRIGVRTLARYEAEGGPFVYYYALAGLRALQNERHLSK